MSTGSASSTNSTTSSTSAHSRSEPPPTAHAPAAAPGRVFRLLPALGLLYPVLSVLAFLAFPAPPGGDVSATHDPSWFAAHLDPVTAQAILRCVAALGFLALSVAVSARAHRPWSSLLVACGATTGGLLLLAQGSVLAAAVVTRQHAGTDLTILDGLNVALLDLSSLPAVAVFGVAATTFSGGVRTARGLAVLSLLGVPLGVLDALSFPGGPLDRFGLVGLVYFLLWSSAVGAYLLVRPRPDVPATDTRAG